MKHTQIPEKNEQRQTLAADIEAFLKNGGQVDVVPSDERKSKKGFNNRKRAKSDDQDSK